MTDVTKSGILNSIKKIEDKNLNKDLLTLNSIKELKTEDNVLSISISIPQPISEINDELQSKFKDALQKDFPHLENIDLHIQGTASTHQQEKKSILSGVKNTIAVASGKGGVGKSTIAVNLAVALAKDGAKVGLIDADIYGPSVPLMLGITEKPKVYKTEKSMKIIPLENYGVKVISIGLLVDDSAPVIWRGPMASGAVKQFMTDVEWGELDYLIFDMPPGTGDIQLTLVQTIPLSGAVIVTTPQEVSLIDARKALKMFERVNVPVLGIVENMSYFITPDTQKKYDIFGTGGGSKLSEKFNIPFLGGMPIDPQIRIGGDEGKPIVYDKENKTQAKVMLEISRKLIEEVEKNSLNNNNDIEIVLNN
ncbi:MAG: iron-sulfur cluster carrier protein ApbC [Ignavibacteriales bacterium CG_4_9_14_3_um_filter_30_11]|nr:MAG: iron-sulfur cluster carrier protein ApbC [Ignavibacteriales bacterium CG_4_9_14_3_um_filter_30_11]